MSARPNENPRLIGSRRRALGLALGASSWLSEAIATGTSAPLRIAISKSVVAEVTLSDARAAMQVFLQRLAQEYNFRLEYNPRIFDASGEILYRTRRGTVDAVVLNILEYRQIAGLLDPSQMVVGAGAKGRDQYVILVKRDGVIKKLDDLRGRRLVVQKGYRMCVAPYWLSTLFQEGQRVPIEQILGAAVMEVKISRSYSWCSLAPPMPAWPISRVLK